MAERFEFEVVSSSGDIVGNDGVASTSSEGRSGGESTQSSRERRQEENQQFRREAAARARQREADRREDRTERRKRRESNEEQRRAEDLDKLRARIQRRNLAREQALVAEVNRGHVLRRRFINNFFGAFNSAHSGRRSNHIIDLLNSITGSRKERESFQPEQAPNRGFNRSSLLRKILTERNLSIEKTIQVNKAIQRGNLKESLRNTRNRISERRFNSSIFTRFSRIRQRTGTVQAARIVGGSFLKSLGPVGSALSKLGPIGLGAGAALLAVTGGALATVGAFVALNRLTGRLIKSIEGIPSPVLFAQIETRFEILNARFRRADRLGEGLARIERIQGENTVKSFGLVDNIASPLLPITETLNRVAGIGLDFLNLLITIDSKIGFLAQIENIGNTLNFILDTIDSIDGKTGNISENILQIVAPSLLFIGRALGFLDDQKDQKESSSGAIMRELFQAMNNPVGDINAPFEVNVGPQKFKNVFAPGI